VDGGVARDGDGRVGATVARQVEKEKGGEGGLGRRQKEKARGKWAALKMPDGLGTGERRKEARLEIRFLIFIFGLNQF
jgi:hypothetical protein